MIFSLLLFSFVGSSFLVKVHDAKMSFEETRCLEFSFWTFLNQKAFYFSLVTLFWKFCRANIYLGIPCFVQRKLTSLNGSIIKFYDFCLFHYIHWNKACNAFQWIWDNYASLKRNVLCFKPRFFTFLLIEILLNFVEVFIFQWFLWCVKKTCNNCLLSLF